MVTKRRVVLIVFLVSVLLLSALVALSFHYARLPERLPRDLEWTWEVQSLQQAAADLPEVEASRHAEALQQFHWMLQEYRVSLFAQQLGTATPVSRKRLERLLQQAAR